MKYSVHITLVLIAIVINLVSFREGHNWGGDFAGYIIQSQTVADGNFDRLKEQIEKNDFILNYPWGYPLLLSPLIEYFNGNLNILKYYTYAFFILSLVFIFFLFRENKAFSLLTIILLAANPYFWELKNDLLADFPNLCFTFLSLLTIHHVIIRKKTIINDYFSGFLIGLTVFLSFIMRNQSLILIPVLLVSQMMIYKKDAFKTTLLFKIITPYLTFILLMYLLFLIIPLKSTSYSVQYNFSIVFILNTIWLNVFYYLNVWSELFRHIFLIHHFSEIFTGMVIFIAIIGFARSIKSEYLIILFFIFSLALFLITPFYQGIRYVLPIIPVFIYLFVKGLAYVSEMLHHKYGRYIFTFTLTVLVLLSFKSIITFSYNHYRSPETMAGPYEDESLEMFVYLKENTDRNDIIGFWKPRVMLLYTERNSVVLQTVNQCSERNVDLLVCYKYATQDQIPLDTITNYPDLFVNEFRNENFAIFRVNRSVTH